MRWLVDWLLETTGSRLGWLSWHTPHARPPTRKHINEAIWTASRVHPPYPAALIPNVAHVQVEVVQVAHGCQRQQACVADVCAGQVQHT